MKTSKIVFVGAPSSGKSTICKALSEHYSTEWMYEYGKEYWIQHQVDRRLTQEQLHKIGVEQNKGEETLLETSNRYLFCDTNAMITATFARYYYGEVHPELEKLAKECVTRYDRTFLCDANIPYEDTWERSGEVFREKFQENA